MTTKNEQKFLDDLLANSSKKVPIMSLEDINKALDGIVPYFTKRGMEPNEFTVLNVSASQDFEGIVRLAVVDVIPPGKKVLDRARQYVVWGYLLPGVIIPTIVRNAGKDYFNLVTQSRFVLAGKVSIEVNRGNVTDTTLPIENQPYNLVERKVPGLQAVTDFVELVYLGNYLEDTGISAKRVAIWALFCKTKVDMDIVDLKAELKDKHAGKNDPVSGPPLHNTEPTLRTLEEVRQRYDDIILNPQKTVNEAYLNDLFSMTALGALFRYIDLKGSPFERI